MDGAQADIADESVLVTDELLENSLGHSIIAIRAH